MSKAEELGSLMQEIMADKVCAQLATGATQLVMGDGNVDADIVFVGEAPGKKEDQQGIPFVGPSGKFLDQMLEVAEMVRADVYITNIVKYRPPNNRDPLPEEKTAFWPYLMRQLEIIDPKVVITLGRHSMECFLPKAKISSQHGKAEKVRFCGREFLVIPLYHPAAALYNGSMRQTLLDDFLGAKKLSETVLLS